MQGGNLGPEYGGLHRIKNQPVRCGKILPAAAYRFFPSGPLKLPGPKEISVISHTPPAFRPEVLLLIHIVLAVSHHMYIDVGIGHLDIIEIK